MNIYCNYHSHTSYSNINVYDSVAKVEEYCKRAKELGHKEVFTTEHGYQGFIFDWLECAEKYGLNVIEGAEVYYVKDRFEKKRDSHHLIIIALNDNGAQELNEIISKAYLEGFYYKPRVDEELLFSLNPNDFVITTACIGGMWNDKEFIVKCKNYFKDNFYLEIQDHNDDMQRKVNKHLLQLSKELNIKLIHGNDSHYIYQEDYKYRDLYVSTKRKGSKADKNEDDKDQQSRESDFILDYPDYDTILERYKTQGVVPYEIAKEALENTKIFHKATPITHINKDIKLTSVVDNPKKELRKILNNEWNKRKYEFPKEKWGEYKKAIKSELKTIEDCNMSAYFCDDYYISKLAQKKYGGVITKTGRGCFTKDSLIHTKNTLKTLDRVEIGDEVISSDGKFHKVVNTMKYHINEDLIKVKTLYNSSSSHPSICTLDHKILTYRDNKREWLQAKYLKKGDYVCIPKMDFGNSFPKVIDLNEYNNFGYKYDDEFIYVKTKTYGKQFKYSTSDVARHIGVGNSVIENFANMKPVFTKKNKEKLKEIFDYIPFETQAEYHNYLENLKTSKIKRYLEVDEEFMMVVGMLYGDGYTKKTSKKQPDCISKISLAINPETKKNNKDIYINFCKKMGFKYNIKKVNNKKVEIITIKNKLFGEFVKRELFVSEKTKFKDFNHLLFCQSKENLEGLYKGLLMTDGSTKDPYRISFDNTSLSLINAFNILTNMTGKCTNSIIVRKSGIDYRGYKRKESYKLRQSANIYNSQKKDHKILQDKNFYYLPVISTEILNNQDTYVYDIEVEGKHDYLLNNMIVHNSAVSFVINNILGLTNIDRLSANITLYPSRFMSTTRILLSHSLPDIDINMADQKPFIQATYDLLGKDNCAWMASFKPLQAQSAFRLYCRSLGMDINEYDSIAKDLEKYNDNPKWNKLIKESEKFIGVIDSISPSPCSILIYDKPVSKELGLITINSKEEDEYGNKKNIEYRCCLLTGLMADHFKYLKNDYLKVLVIKIISETFKKVGIKVPSINELKELVAKDNKTWNIYEKGLTCTINQADSDFGTQCAMRYKPKSVEEMSAFVAILRPGCASLRDDFLDRKPYTTGVKELDNLLSDGSGRMIYQELIMKYLIWLGIEESETYGIIKKISKKKFSNEDLEELKSKLKKGWIKQVGKEDGFEKTWQIVEDASKYSFNASHSLSYAYDSVYQAYLKSHYPLEYYSTVLEMYNKDTDRTIKLTNELKYFGISLKPIKFGYSTSKYNYDKETMTIYKGVRSVKKMNAHVADELYELSQSKNYDNIVELLIDIKEKTNINKSQLENLIKLDYFSDYGNDKYILRVNDVIKTYMKVKQIKKNDLFDRGINEDIVRACAEKETEKMFKGINNLKLINMLILGFDKNEKCNIKEKCESEVELLGECIYKNKAIDNYYYIVTNKIENARPKVNIHNLSNGENLSVYITHGFSKRPVKQFSIIIVNEINKEPKYKYIGKDDKGKAKYEKLEGQFKDVLSDYEVINY